MSNIKKGKFNIIDFLIIVLFLGAIAFAGLKLYSGTQENANAENMQLIQVKYHYKQVPNFVAEKIKVGDPVLDFLTDNNLGTVTNVEISDSVFYGSNAKGEVVASSKEDHRTVTITTEVRAKISSASGAAIHGFEVRKAMYPVGYYLSVLCGDAKVYAEITEIKSLEKGGN